MTATVAGIVPLRKIKTIEELDVKIAAVRNMLDTFDIVDSRRQWLQDWLNFYIKRRRQLLDVRDNTLPK